MFIALMIVAMLAGLTLALSLALYVYKTYWVDQAEERSRRNKEKNLRRTGTHQFEDEKEGTFRQSLEVLGVPDVRPGSVLLGLPVLGSSTVTDRLVVRSLSRIFTYPSQGAKVMDFLELTGGAAELALLSTGKNLLYLARRRLSSREAELLERERQQAVDRGDGDVPELFGFHWTIKWAWGTNTDHQMGEGRDSTFEVLSFDRELGSELFSERMLSGGASSYFDVAMFNDDEPEDSSLSKLYAFYVDGEWFCYLGKLLTDTERRGIEILAAK